MPEPQVAGKEIESEREQVVGDCELGATAELDAGHVPPVLARDAAIDGAALPRTGCRRPAPEFESNAVPPLMQ